ncbi:MAG: DUF2358 domain-containing protein [Leptolyngbyaceae cyanobacterium SM1_3_5]|nr:DUF2358 domain-containing protein [Leptolyngbyaceae cyanobacterium SM1_3_5]
MDIVENLREDYHRFPKNQTYSLYAEDVYFKDPMSQFRGLKLFKGMVKLIDTFFLNCKMDLHQIERSGQEIRMEWTLSWNSPLPWKPFTRVDGWTELKLNEQEKICSHIDYWHCSRLDVLKQQLPKRQNEQKPDKVKEM